MSVTEFCPKTEATFETAFSQALDTGKFHLECRVVRPDDETRWVVAEGRLYRDEHGRPLRLAGTVRDVTERRQVEESLRQTQKLEVIGQLTGGVAHDFNNLLTAVLGNIELAALRTRDQNVLGILKSAGTAAERGAKFTGQLLAFARKQHLAPRVVSLNELVSSMGDLLLQTIGVTIRIETVLEKDLWAVMIDPTQLELVILNLAINSRDAMPHGGRLTVATKNIGVSDRHRPAGLARAGIRRDIGERHRLGHDAGSGGKSIRAVLHDQSGRTRNRARAEPGSRLRATIRRRGSHRFARRTGHDDHDFPAAKPRVFTEGG